jgi:hypothetical protein
MQIVDAPAFLARRVAASVSWVEPEWETVSFELLKTRRAQPLTKPNHASVAVPEASLFRSGRQFAAWLGPTPRAHSSGGKERLGGISEQGDGYLRKLLVVGATAVMRMARMDATRKRDRWVRDSAYCTPVSASILSDAKISGTA